MGSTCLDYGIELRRDFVVKITHEDKPLPGVAVQIINFVENKSTTVFSGKTAIDGTIHISQLQPGNYWINAEILEIVLHNECFHVNPYASRKAKREVSFEWEEDLAPAFPQVAGRIINSERAQGGTPTWNLTHRVEAPIAGAKLTLRSPYSEVVYNTVADDNGHFALSDIP